MKITYLLFIINFILLSSQGYSQNWNLINPDYIYNYTSDNLNYISSSIWTDSTTFTDNTEVYHLNRIVSNCDTCEQRDKNTPKFASYNTSQFLQRNVIKTDSSFEFNGPNAFTILHKAGIGTAWFFDKKNLITATTIEHGIIENQTFTDSIKTIVLSTNDTIIFSKNYGIIRFDDCYTEHSYSWLGIDGLIGKSVPNFYDFFDFEIGDVFEYHGFSYSTDVDPFYYIEKSTILRKTKINNSLVYDVKTIKNTAKHFIDEIWHFGGLPNIQEFETQWIFEDSINHPTNRYNNQLISIYDYLKYSYCDAYDLTKTTYNINKQGKYTLDVGLYPGHNNEAHLYSIIDTNNYLMKIIYLTACDEHHLVFTENAGLTFRENSGFEWWREDRLVAYKSGNDTIGTLTPNWLLLNTSKIAQNEFIFYPNPVKNVLHLKTPNNSEIKVSIMNHKGDILISSKAKASIDVSMLESGVYLAIFENEGERHYQKFIKEK